MGRTGGVLAIIHTAISSINSGPQSKSDFVKVWDKNRQYKDFKNMPIRYSR